MNIFHDYFLFVGTQDEEDEYGRREIREKIEIQTSATLLKQLHQMAT